MAIIIIAGFSVSTVAAADGTFSLNKQLCTYNKSSSCRTQQSTTINVARTGTYRLEVVVERGNDITRFECQDQESFYMVINGQRTPVVNDPDRCENRGTVKRQNVSGTYNLRQGNNTVVLYHAYTLRQADSVESLTVQSMDIFLPAPPAPTPINGQCGSANGQTVDSRPSNNLCAVGSASAVSGNGPWSWTCAGSNGGRAASCSAQITVAPTCGSANGQSFSSAPSSGLCGIGTASSVAHGTSQWTWTCISGARTVNCQASESRVAIGIEKRNGSNNGDDQTIQRGAAATFTITVTNTGEDRLTHVIVSDQEAPNCNRTESQTQGLYGDAFDPRESFTYTCTDEGVQAGYTNIAEVTARAATGSQTVTSRDNSRVSLATDPTPNPTPEPVEPVEPEDEDECDGAIGNFVWHDRNKNGVQEAGEEGISDVRLKLYNGDDIEKDTTNATGRYKFKDLCEGSYRVVVAEETLPQGCYQTFDKDGDLDNKTKVSISGDEYFRKADFGYYCPSNQPVKTSPQTGAGMIASLIALGSALVAAYLVHRNKWLVR